MDSPAHAADAREASPLYPIVLIDDDPDDLFFITRRIRRSGAGNPVVTFADGADAVQHFKHAGRNGHAMPPACVVFCDIKMPRMDGFEVLRWFRGQTIFAPIHFFMLSGSNEFVDRKLARELGANDYLVKFPPEERFAETIRVASAMVAAAFRRVA